MNESEKQEDVYRMKDIQRTLYDLCWSYINENVSTESVTAAFNDILANFAEVNYFKFKI